MSGNWKLSEMKPCGLPEQVATGFAEAISGLVGTAYIPVLYCGEQLVHGTNYILICKQTLITAQPEDHLVKIILNQPLPSDHETTWKIILVDTIC